MPVFVFSPWKPVETQVGGDIVPGGAVASPIADIVVRTMEQIGREENHGAGGHFEVQCDLVINLGPTAVPRGDLRVFPDDSIPMGPGDDAKTAVLDICLFQIDTAGDDPIGNRAEVEVVLVPACGGSAVRQLGEELRAETIDVRSGKSLDSIEDLRFFGQFQDPRVNRTDSLDLVQEAGYRISVLIEL